MAITELILVRHGESAGNVAAFEADRLGADRVAIPSRDADVPLTPLGLQQAAAVGARLASLSPTERPDIVLSSPYRRAHQTALVAMATADPSGSTRIIVDERLRDRELGVLDTYTSRGVDEHFPEEAARRRFLGKFFYRPPGGEAWTDVALRVRSFVRDLDRFPENTRALVVCHDAVVSLFRYVCEGWDEHRVLEEAALRPTPNASFTHLVSDGRSWTSLTANATAHLDEQSVVVTTHSGEPDAER
ncbi:MAG TPA: histidine phosphatase family protein [Plantibacter sp.]|uniref:histidine phosphatase family protein n=1 Tax=unclassified Plantibacter TaxID=2624265 RepID=UPI002B9B9777|nr:histidine phosphatase family protein [Plantibacter sp.]